MITLAEPMKNLISSLDDKPENVTAAAAFWITPEDKALGFALWTDDPNARRDLAKMLRDHAEALER
jgi:hypothetical protein